jgi:hypothetical protein
MRGRRCGSEMHGSRFADKCRGCCKRQEATRCWMRQVRTTRRNCKPQSREGRLRFGEGVDGRKACDCFFVHGLLMKNVCCVIICRVRPLSSTRASPGFVRLPSNAAEPHPLPFLPHSAPPTPYVGGAQGRRGAPVATQESSTPIVTGPHYRRHGDRLPDRPVRPNPLTTNPFIDFTRRIVC